MPSVGLGYQLAQKSDGSLTSQIRPSVAYSIGDVSRIWSDKKMRKREREFLIEQNKIELEIERDRLREAIKKRDLKKIEIGEASDLIEIEEKIFQIDSVKFEEKKTLPRQFLSAKLGIMRSRQSVESKRREFEELKEIVFVISRFRFELD